jgi:hypothetical protein
MAIESQVRKIFYSLLSKMLSNSVPESYVDDALSKKITVANKIVGEINANSLNKL